MSKIWQVQFKYLLANSASAVVLFSLHQLELRSQLDPGWLHLSFWPSTLLILLVCALPVRPMLYLPGLLLAATVFAWNITPLLFTGLPSWVGIPFGIFQICIYFFAVHFTRCRLQKESLLIRTHILFLTIIAGILLASLPAVLAGSAIQQLGTHPWPFNLWLDWWIRDVFAAVTILSLLPIIQTISARNWKNPLLYYFLPTLALVFACMTIYSIVSDQEDDLAEEAFRSGSDRVVLALLENLNAYVLGLEMLTESRNLSIAPSTESFARLAQISKRHHPELQTINWISVIKHSQRSIFEQAYQNCGYPEFYFARYEDGQRLRAADAAEYYVVVATEPVAGNEEIIGVDLKQSKFVGSILTEALQGGSPRATPPLRLTQEKGTSNGVVFYAPFSLTETQQNGFYSYVFRIDPLLNNLWETYAVTGLQARLTDITEPSIPLFIGQIGYGNADENALDHAIRGMHSTKKIEVLNRQWQISFHMPASFVKENRPNASIYIQLGGILTTGLLSFYLIGLFRRNIQIDATVQSRTAELQKAKEEAEASTRIKNEFLAMTNHELRTPLNGILATTDLLVEEPMPSHQLRLVRMIQDSGHVLLGLINNILDVARLDAQRLELHPAPFRLQQLIERLENVFSASAREKGLELVFSYSDTTLCTKTLTGDISRIGQVLVNLVGNAIKFTEHGRVVVHIECHAKESGTTALWLFRVEDTGIGVEINRIPSLFKAFEQGDSQTHRKYGGTGLGLNISAQLTDLMGGWLLATSMPGQGAKFALYLHLPTHSGSATDVAPPVVSESTPPLPQPPTAESTTAKPSILIVEDIPLNQTIIRLILQKMDLHAVIADNAESALAALQNEDFQLILMDCHLPDRDGPHLTREIRKLPHYAHIPIIALTADTTEANRIQCKEAGMNDFLSKPINRQTIASIIHKWLPTT